jgi:3,4-dihydroxy 2-butanone 4-phosphate synthase/GTP cyclohydrolase II
MMKTVKMKVISWLQQRTPEMINFMATHGRINLCALTESRCKKLGLHVMVTNNTDQWKLLLVSSI